MRRYCEWIVRFIRSDSFAPGPSDLAITSPLGSILANLEQEIGWM